MISLLIHTFQLTPAQAELYASCFETREFKAGERFVEYGRISHKVGFVERGLLKCELRKDAKVAIDDFVFEGQFVANYFSFLQQQASNKDIICLKPSVLRVATRERLLRLAEAHSFLADMARQVAEKLFLSTHQKLEDLRLLSAEERYLKLLRTHPRMVAEIPQYEIAAYLNVSPETVSRIRRKLAQRS